MIMIRHITGEDFEAYQQLCTQLDEETSFMMLEPGERSESLEEGRRKMEQLLTQENQMIFVAEHEHKLVGYLAAIGGNFRRNQHSAYIVIGVLQTYTAQGIGRKLFTAMELWARQQQLHRLELTVMMHNERGVKLYKKMGFAIEGTKRDSLYVDGEYVDEYYMAKLL